MISCKSFLILFLKKIIKKFFSCISVLYSFTLNNKVLFMNQDDLIKEIGHIRSMMEKSSKFISISGLSGILIGLYALLGAALAYIKIDGIQSGLDYQERTIDKSTVTFLILLALAVLAASLLTGIWMAGRKARRIKQSIWNVTSRSLLFALAVPLVTGGIVCIIWVIKGYYMLVASTLLVFYGLALTAGSVYTFKEVRWLGLLEIMLGLLALLLPGYGLWLWAAGFGLLHMIYGFIVYKKYE